MYSKEYVKLLKEEQDIQEAHKKELTTHREKIYAFRDKCNHKWNYHSDPSGGSDSYWGCDICDKTTSSDPHYKPPHVLEDKDKGLTINELCVKYPQGWKLA